VKARIFGDLMFLRVGWNIRLDVVFLESKRDSSGEALVDIQREVG
jgi:hypothetical protein